MNNLVYIRSQTNTVETLRQIITDVLMRVNRLAGFTRFDVTPGGGLEAGILFRFEPGGKSAMTDANTEETSQDNVDSLRGYKRMEG